MFISNTCSLSECESDVLTSGIDSAAFVHLVCSFAQVFQTGFR